MIVIVKSNSGIIISKSNKSSNRENIILEIELHDSC